MDLNLSCPGAADYEPRRELELRSGTAGLSSPQQLVESTALLSIRGDQTAAGSSLIVLMPEETRLGGRRSILDDAFLAPFVSGEKGLPPAVERRLAELGQLPEGWDSYGAPSISGEAIQKAKSILLQICTIAGLEFCQQSFIVPSSDAGLALEWYLASGKELTFEIPPGGDPVTYLLVEPTHEDGDKETKGTIRHMEDLNYILQRVRYGD